MTIAAPPTQVEVPRTFKGKTGTLGPATIKVRRKFGIWFYGIVFLISSLIGSILLVCLVHDIIVAAEIPGAGNISVIFMTAILATVTFVLLLLGILTLSRKERGLILVICSLLTLWGVVGKIWYAYSAPLGPVISGPNSAFELLFLASILIFFIRPKTKEQFRLIAAQRAHCNDIKKSRKPVYDRRTFGVWFYGIVFLIQGLIGSVVVLGMIIITRLLVVGNVPPLVVFVNVLCAALVIGLSLSGILTLSRRKRGVILAFCSLLTLWGVVGKIWYTYFAPLSTVISAPDSVFDFLAPVISGPNSAFELVFLASTLLFFIRPKIKDQFRRVAAQRAACNQIKKSRKRAFVIGISCMGLAVCLVIFPFIPRTDATYVHNLEITADPEQDPLACALYISQKTILENNNDKAKLYTKIAVAYAESGQYDQALSIASALQKSYMKVRTLVMIASECTKAEQKDKASDILSLALQLTETIEDDYIKDEGLNSIADQHAKAGRFDQALQIVGRINNLHDKTLAMEQIAINYARSGHTDKACDILDKILQESKTGNFRESYMRDFKEIAVAYAKIGQYDKALETAELIKEHSSLAVALTEIAGNIKPANSPKGLEILSQALAAAQKMENPEGFQKDKKCRRLSDIAAGYAEIGQYEQAMQIADNIEHQICKGKALTSIAFSYAEDGQADKVLDLLWHASDATVHSDTNSLMFFYLSFEIASCYAKIDREDKAFFVLSSVLPLVDTIERPERQDGGDRLKSVFLLIIARHYAEFGGYDQAIEIAGKIKHSSRRANALVDILIHYEAATRKDASQGQNNIMHEILKDFG